MYILFRDRDGLRITQVGEQQRIQFGALAFIHHGEILAVCPTREAVEAAKRLLDM